MANMLELVKFNADGLVPAVTQDIRTDEVLMLAWMNEESLRKTIETGKVHYYSRSRQKLWLKGETSGHFQQVRSISVDCDGDTLLIKVEQTGAACHTGHRSCFFTRMDLDALREGSAQGFSGVETETTVSTGVETGIAISSEPETFAESEAVFSVSPSAGAEAGTAASAAPEAGASGVAPRDEAVQAGPEVLGKVFGVISDRLVHPKEGSYTNYLFGKGLDKILKKVGEEACEVVIASKNGSGEEIGAEIADLLYHLMVLLVEKGMTLEDIYGELKKRE